MPDIGLFELLLIGIIALIVVGPEDLPKMFAAAGRWTGRVKAMAREFQRSMNEAAGESGYSDVKRDFDQVRKYTNPRKAAREAVDDLTGPLREIERDLDPDSETGKLAARRKSAQPAARARADKLAADRAAARAAETPAPPTETTPGNASRHGHTGRAARPVGGTRNRDRHATGRDRDCGPDRRTPGGGG